MTHIFLDSDGVLAAFDEHVYAQWGKTCRELGDAELWARVEDYPNFWLDMPVKDEAYDLFDLVLPFKPTILTGCPATGYDRAAAHKVEWYAKHFGSKYGYEIPVITCRSKDKALHMKAPGDVLVDDFFVNIKRWRAAGGKGVWYVDPVLGRGEVAEHLLKLVDENQ
jgi:hypothetical protein